VVGNLLSSAVDDVRDLVCNYELQILKGEYEGRTWEASSSPIKRPSFIFIAPIISGSKGKGGGWG